MIPPVIVPHYSYKKTWLASVLLLVFLCLPAHAQAADDFSVENVMVDSGGKDTSTARDKALAGGEKSAFAQLITRKSPTKAKDIIAKTTDKEISVMVRGFEVVDEKMTADHYHATLNYNFDPHAINALIGEPPAPVPSTATPNAESGKSHAAGAPPTVATANAKASETPVTAAEHASKAVLVLPVYNDGTSLKLWQDDNKWRNVWYEAALEAGGGLVIAPLGDFDDRVDVDDTNVMTATAKSLSRLYGRYGVGEIYVLSAFYNQKADPKPTLEVTVRKLLPGKIESSQMNFTIHSTETLDTLLVRASNDIARSIYTQQTIDPNKIEYDRLKEINARVNTSDIHEWEALRKRLLTHGNIVGIRLTSISFYETTMVITFKGTADMLGKTLVASGLRVMEDGDSLVLALK